MKVRKAIKPWRYPEATERQLSRSISDMVANLSDRAKQSIKGMKFDASDDEIKNEESDLEYYAALLIATLMLLIRPMGVTIYIFNSRQWLSVAKSSGGGQNAAVMLLDQTGPTQLEPWLMEKRKLWESSAEQALRKLANNIIADWSTKVRLLNMQEKGNDAVAKAIDARASVWGSWAENRARGIVSTFNSVLMKQRLNDAGVDSYIWRGMLDERERLQHLNWEGKIIRFDEDHDFPGEPYGCRCWAQPNWPKNEEDKK